MGTAKRPTKTSKRPAITKTKKSSNRWPSWLTAKNRRLPFRQMLAIYLILIGISAACAAAVGYANNKPSELPNPFPAGQQALVSYSLYYPASLPVLYTVDPASVSSPQAQVVTMRITNGLGTSEQARSMTISQQPVPAGFLFKTFYDSFIRKEIYKTKLGDVTIGGIDNSQTTLASLVTPDQTWILLSADTRVSRDDIKYVMSHLVVQTPAK